MVHQSELDYIKIDSAFYQSDSFQDPDTIPLWDIKLFDGQLTLERLVYSLSFLFCLSVVYHDRALQINLEILLNKFEEARVSIKSFDASLHYIKTRYPGLPVWLVMALVAKRLKK